MVALLRFFTFIASFLVRIDEIIDTHTEYSGDDDDDDDDDDIVDDNDERHSKALRYALSLAIPYALGMSA
jgi:hypothetical protein